MTKVFIAASQVQDNIATITGTDAKHLSLVLRKEANDQLLIGVDQTTYAGVIIKIDQNQVIVSLKQQLDTQGESPLITTLYQGIPKGDKFELVIQKAVELGVTEIVPLFTRYTVVKLDEQRQLKKVARWQKIAEESAKQCKRDLIPQVNMPITFNELIDKLNYSDTKHLSIMAYENEQELSLKQLAELNLSQVDLIIGPEGGFAKEEVAAFQALEHGRIITLGSRILRTETAAISMLTLVQYLWGDLG